MTPTPLIKDSALQTGLPCINPKATDATLLDLFAAHALSGLMGLNIFGRSADSIAREAYGIAQAMLTVREDYKVRPDVVAPR